jgi:bifunctional DNA-binding transcriptional regulator/antitoxin component of YhaV-PrlF toxin-antitoxin module
MTIKLRNKPVIEGLHIPEEVLEKTSLKNAESISVYTNECSIVMMDEAMTALQIIRTVDMLNTVATGLIMRLETAARQHEEKCRRINIPEELLEMSGIPKGAPLDICVREGELYISVLEDEDDPAEALPSYLRDIFDDSSLDFGVLRHLLESEEIIHE